GQALDAAAKRGVQLHFDVSLISNRLPVSAGIGCGDISAMFLSQYDLCGPELQAVGALGFDAVAAGLQGICYGFRYMGLQHHARPGLDAEAWRVDGGLRVALKVHELLHHLYMALCLHIAAHDAKAGERLAFTGDECGNNGMQGTFSWRYLVAMARHQ